MATVETNLASPAHVAEHEHHEPDSFWRKYIFSEDHKTIAKQYLFSGIFIYFPPKIIQKTKNKLTSP